MSSVQASRAWKHEGPCGETPFSAAGGWAAATIEGVRVRCTLTGSGERRAHSGRWNV